jgi:Xaa-Pro aminopeptidase
MAKKTAAKAAPRKTTAVARKPARKPAASPRLAALRKAIKAAGLDAIIVVDRKNVKYLCGFDGSYGKLVVDARNARLVTDERYAEIAAGMVTGAKVVVQPLTGVDAFLTTLLAESGYKTIGFEGTMSFNEAEHLRGIARRAKAKLAECAAIVRDLRRTKDAEELKRIAKAAQIADKMMAAAFEALAPGVTEIEVARVIRAAAEKYGAEGESFSCIVASGPNASRPHHSPSSRRIRKGDMVTIDLGAVYKGYCSDITRTVAMGKVHPRFEEIYTVCLEAQEAAVKATRAGITGKDLDAVARDIIEAAGFGPQFGHGLGHGVGMDIHEAPRNSKASADTLAVDDVVTIEPGIYVPGFGGVRIEDLLVVTNGKPKVLSRTPKGLLVIPC